MSRLILPQVHPTFDFVKEKFSAVAMSEGNHPSGSEALRDDTERSRGGGPHTPTLKAAAPKEQSQKDEVYLTGENIVDFDGDGDPANPLNCKPFRKIPPSFS